MTRSTADSASASTCSGGMLPIGWPTATVDPRSKPSADHCSAAGFRKAVVARTAVLMPAISSCAMSCTLHDVQDPQSEIAVMTMSHRFNCSICSGGAGREKIGFVR